MRNTSTKTETSVKNGIRILKRAISRGISLSEASRTFDFGRNYVSDVKARIKNNYKRKNISRDLYTEFNTLMKEYTA